MATDERVTPTAEDAFVSLYRRYRPGRFSELRGQDHVVRALRSAVRDGHVAHAYLFSGPRGTGKTSTARILAKALNCLHPDDGDPCGVCPSCVAITKGISMDVTELDAASNNGVDEVRDLIAHAALGSPGRRKVYIIDEVHMLSTAASNALLKTLEEPPGHVVFVLATTDPQKVPATIRSRTQHLEFRLLGAEVLEGLLRDVRDDAGLALDDELVSLAVRKGRGSARDALSALDQVAASGEIADSRPTLLAEIVEGIALEDPARSLVAMTSLREVGWGPEQLGTELVDELRQAFLLRVAPELAEVTGTDRVRLGEQGEQLGLARIVRAIELVGRAQVEMRSAPDPLVIFEVAVVRAARSDADSGTAGLLDRLAKLERRVAELSAVAPSSVSSTPGPAQRIAEVPTGQKPALGAFAATPAASQMAPETVSSPAPAESEPAEHAPAEARQDLTTPPSGPSPGPEPVAGGVLSAEEVLAAWSGPVLGGLSTPRRVQFSTRPVRYADGVLTVSVPTEQFRASCAEHVPALAVALAEHLGQTVRLEVAVEAESRVPTSSPSSTLGDPAEAAEGDEADDAVTEGDLEDLASGAGGVSVPAGSVAADKIFEAFPGATEASD